jgi:hypothetical protein
MQLRRVAIEQAVIANRYSVAVLTVRNISLPNVTEHLQFCKLVWARKWSLGFHKGKITAFFKIVSSVATAA